jgi:hypothetical protein
MIHPISNLIWQPAIGLQLALGEVVGQPGFNACERLMTILLVSQVRTNSSIYLGVNHTEILVGLLHKR